MWIRINDILVFAILYEVFDSTNKLKIVLVQNKPQKKTNENLKYTF